MPRAIAIETSGRIGSIALVDGDAVIAEEQFPHGLQHAAEIIPIIDRLCRAQPWAPADIEQLYLSTGPGSFTGLRIAVTLAKTLALATGVRIAAVPTMHVLVENAPADAREVVVVLDAKRAQVYTARFRRQAADQGWTEVEMAHLDTLTAILSRASRPVHLLGEGIAYHRDSIPPDADVIVIPEPHWRARASVVARLGMEMASRAEWTDADRLSPIYIRLPEAEEKRLASQRDAQ